METKFTYISLNARITNKSFIHQTRGRWTKKEGESEREREKEEKVFFDITGLENTK